MIEDMIVRGWHNFLARPDGPVSFRFVVQPVLVSVIALRAGVKDAREGRPAYFWAAFTDSEYRREFLRGGWKDIRAPFLLSAGLDLVYQVIVHHFIYPLETIFTGTLLAAVPYVTIRGLVGCIARRVAGPRGTSPT